MRPDRLTPSHTKKKTGQRLRYYVSRRLIQHSGQKDLSGWRLPAPMLEQTVVHLIRQHVDATTFSASLIHTPTMQELASVRRFLDGLCSGSNDDSASVAPVLCQNLIHWQRYKSAFERRHFRDIALVRTTSGCS